MIVIGLDPGFASTGWALMEIHGKPFKVLAMGVLRTKKSSAKGHVLATDDNFRRSREIARFIEGLVTGHHQETNIEHQDTRKAASMICMEAMSFMRNASSMAKVALAYGVVAAIAASMDIPVAQVSPQKIKKACGVESRPTGKSTKEKKASKAQVRDALERMYPETVAMVAHIPDGQCEHPFDALASIQACQESEIFRALIAGAMVA